MARLFGTDGVRGIANEELTIELAMQLGKYGAYAITQGKKEATILVGMDTRISGNMLENALIAGILSTGCHVKRLGVIPTPAVAKLIRTLGADAGVMISASHNPAQFNGIKFFNEKGFKLKDALEDEIEKMIKDHVQIPNTVIGTVSDYEHAKEDYINYILKTIDSENFQGLKVAVDCANGAAYEVGPYALNELGAKVYPIHHDPDGLNINEDCGSTHLDHLKQYVKTINADIGLAFDGDADRLLAIDEEGQLVDGDKIMVICGHYINQKQALANQTIVATVMSNLGFDKAVESHDMKHIKTKVGDRYVLEEMVSGGYGLGGEQSGHIIFLEHNTTGDGLLTAVQLLDVMKQTGKKLSELARMMTVYPQVLKNAKVANTLKHDYMNNVKIAQRIKEVETAFHGNGRVLIRPSGTEPLVRVMIEGENQNMLDEVATELVTLIESELHV